MNLTEATMLAIQGKLKLDESKEVNSLSSSSNIKNWIEDKTKRKEAKMKKESIDVSVDDNGATIVETPEATVIVTDTQNATEAPTEEVTVAEVPDEVETVEIPVEGDETIIPEEIVEPDITEEPTIDEIVDGDTEEDLEESKKSCEDCGKEKCECEKVEESKKTEAIASEGNTTFALKMECVNDAFGGMNENGEGNPDKMQAEVARILKDIAEKIANGEYSNDSNILDKNGNVVGKYGFGFEGVVDPFTESKKVEENVEIEVSEDGTEVEVKTDEGENVEVIDETEEPETSDEAEETASEEVVEVPEEETAEEVEDDSEFIEESFEKALTEYYKNNTKSIKGYKIEKISKDRNSIKIEGLLINKLNKSVKTELKANKVQEGKFYTRYEIANIKGLLESKISTKGTMITKTTKESKLECTSITNKKLVK